MTPAEIANIRLANQHIGGSLFKTPAQLADWMGALQAQDYPMSKWAFGVRLPGSDNSQIEAAADNGEILRTHLLRPTWHFVAAKNIRWLIGISAASIRSSLLYRHRQLGIDDRKIEKSIESFREILKDGNHLTRDEIISIFREESISQENTTTYHILLWAELMGVVCSGRRKGKEQTYALLEERAPAQEELTRDEAITRLAGTYFSSHGPATLKDFMWWSGLGTNEARKAISGLSFLEKFEYEGSVYWMKTVEHDEIRNSVYLLPAYDEYLISYTDRSAVLTTKFNSKAVSSNGIFRPVVAINGKIAGLWKRSSAGEKMRIDIDLFKDAGAKTKKLILKSTEEYSMFSGKKPEIKFV